MHYLRKGTNAHTDKIASSRAPVGAKNTLRLRLIPFSDCYQTSQDTPIIITMITPITKRLLADYNLLIILHSQSTETIDCETIADSDGHTD